MKNMYALIIGCILAVFIAEVFLRVYNPFHFRVFGTAIIMPVNRQYVITNDSIPGLDSLIRHTKNSLGFRGPEMPDDAAQVFSLIAVGGSTTEQFYLSDGSTWVDLLGRYMQEAGIKAWVNNAGLDGHSTFGHRVLLEQHLAQLHPESILFLVGVNEIGRHDLLGGADRSLLRTAYTGVFDFIVKKSALVDTVLNIARVVRARRLHIQHSLVDVRLMPEKNIFEAAFAARLHQEEPLVAAYRKRIRELLRMARAQGSEPVLITQPMLWGARKDVATGLDLGRVAVQEGMNGALYAELLERYNDATRAVGKELGVPVVDLGKRMPPDSRLYYDGVHFSKSGAEKVAEIIWTSLKTFGLF